MLAHDVNLSVAAYTRILFVVYIVLWATDETFCGSHFIGGAHENVPSMKSPLLAGYRTDFVGDVL